MIKVIGHRGRRGHSTVDENSLAAFKAALEGADGLETDVHASADNTPFLLHDLSEVGLGGKVETLSDKDILALRLKKGGRVPQLSELFNLAAQYPDKILDIELKTVEAVAPAMQALEAAVISGQVKKENIILTSFSPQALIRVRDTDPHIRCGLIMNNLAGGMGKVLELDKLVPEYFILRSNDVTVADARWVYERFPDAKIMVWTTREGPPERNAAVQNILKDPDMAALVDTIITDYPAAMKKFLKRFMKGNAP